MKVAMNVPHHHHQVACHYQQGQRYGTTKLDILRGTTVCSSASEPLQTLSENSNETNFNYGAAVDDYVNSTEYIAVQENTAVGAPLAIETVNINELPVHIEGNITVQDLHNSIDQLKYICLENQKCINDIYKILRNMSLKEGEINVSQKEKFCKWLPLVDLDKLKQFEDELNQPPDLNESFVSIWVAVYLTFTKMLLSY
uniref:Uncharacterized protein n=1 Tax=Photinus pyralis TaxID=7054 RepID=A0A1Y1N0A8_PHOPY